MSDTCDHIAVTDRVHRLVRAYGHGQVTHRGHAGDQGAGQGEVPQQHQSGGQEEEEEGVQHLGRG